MTQHEWELKMMTNFEKFSIKAKQKLKSEQSQNPLVKLLLFNFEEQTND